MRNYNKSLVSKNRIASLKNEIKHLKNVMGHLAKEVKRLDWEEEVVLHTIKALRRHKDYYHADCLQKVLDHAKKVNEASRAGLDFLKRP